MERHVRALLRLPSSVFTFEFVFFGFTWDCTILPPSFKFRPVSVQEKEEEKSLGQHPEKRGFCNDRNNYRPTILSSSTDAA